MRLLLLVALCLLVGCATPAPILAAASGNTRDLRLIQDVVIPKLPADMQADWTENLIVFAVRSQVLEAYLRGDHEFHQRVAEAAETERALTAREEAGDGR